MSTDEMKIAAAQSIGWIPHGSKSTKLPNYNSDLNAMAAIISTLSSCEALGDDGQYQSERGKFNSELERIVQRDLAGTKQEKFLFDIINATAIQRLEAYLITKGLWIVKE